MRRSRVVALGAGGNRDETTMGWVMGDRDKGRPDGLMQARRMGPGDGVADDDVSAHGMPEIPGAGDGFAGAPRVPRGDGLAGEVGDDVEGHVFAPRAQGQLSDEEARSTAATDEASPG